MRGCSTEDGEVANKQPTRTEVPHALLHEEEGGESQARRSLWGRKIDDDQANSGEKAGSEKLLLNFLLLARWVTAAQDLDLQMGGGGQHLVFLTGWRFPPSAESLGNRDQAET